MACFSRMKTAPVIELVNKPKAETLFIKKRGSNVSTVTQLVKLVCAETCTEDVKNGSSTDLSRGFVVPDKLAMFLNCE